MSKRHVYLNGEILPVDKARISPFDRGFLFGDGIFETMRAYDRHVFQIDRHFERLFDSLAALRIALPQSREDLVSGCKLLLDANGENDVGIRITVTRGKVDGPFGLIDSSHPTCLIHTRKIPDQQKLDEGISAIISKNTVIGRSPFMGRKTLNYLPSLFAKQESLDAGCYEALIRNEAGQLVEGATSNIFFILDGKVYTPPVESLMLAGITRANCMEIFSKENIPCNEQSLDDDVLDRCSELLIVNSVAEVVPVVMVDERLIGTGKPGPIFLKLAKKYRELVVIDKSRY